MTEATTSVSYSDLNPLSKSTKKWKTKRQKRRRRSITGTTSAGRRPQTANHSKGFDGKCWLMMRFGLSLCVWPAKVEGSYMKKKGFGSYTSSGNESKYFTDRNNAISSSQKDFGSHCCFTVCSPYWILNSSVCFSPSSSERRPLSAGELLRQRAAGVAV